MRLYERWFQAGEKLWDQYDGTELVAFFNDLKLRTIEEQREFFLEISATHGDAARATVDEGIELATDFYPRMDAGSFPSFENLVNPAK